MLIADQLSLTNSDIVGQGILELVREKSVKSQGILLSKVCGNPELKEKVKQQITISASTNIF